MNKDRDTKEDQITGGLLVSELEEKTIGDQIRELTDVAPNPLPPTGNKFTKSGFYKK